jgi:uncharacterized protein YcfJ
MKKLLLFLLAGSVGLAQTVAVRRNLTANGTLLGAVAGAIIGNNSGGHNGAKGALVGAAAGAILGNAVADAQGVPQYRGGDPVIGGAVLGGITGAVIGNNSWHRNGGQGALIGAAAGAILGSSAYQQPAPRPYYGYGYGRSYGSYYGRPAYYGREYRPGQNTAAGFFLGGIAGAIIGNNSGLQYIGRGALIGAGIGALLGAASEPAARDYYEQPRYYAPARTSYVQQMQAMQPAPQQVTIINNYYANAGPSSGGYKTDPGAY